MQLPQKSLRLLVAFTELPQSQSWPRHEGGAYSPASNSQQKSQTSVRGQYIIDVPPLLPSHSYPGVLPSQWQTTVSFLWKFCAMLKKLQQEWRPHQQSVKNIQFLDDFFSPHYIEVIQSSPCVSQKWGMLQWLSILQMRCVTVLGLRCMRAYIQLCIHNEYEETWDMIAIGLSQALLSS